MRRLVVAVTAAALLAGGAWAASAATAGSRSPLKCMDGVWRTTEVSTTSTTFVAVPGLSDSPVAIYPIAVDVSAVVSGAPAQFRILSTNVGGQTHASAPGAAQFIPDGGRWDSFAYRWVEPNQSAATHSTFLRLQWRSPSGSPVRMLRGVMTVSYTTNSCVGSP